MTHFSWYMQGLFHDVDGGRGEGWVGESSDKLFEDLTKKKSKLLELLFKPYPHSSGYD